MAGKDEVWSIIAPIVEGAGFVLFDVEVPSQPGGVLRVLISKPAGGSIILDECASVSKKLEDVVALDEAIPGSYILEVSSPGINRKLTRPEHYKSAVGERVKIVAEKVGEEPNVFRGKVIGSDGVIVTIEDEELKKEVSVSIDKIRKARVDFPFK